MRKIYVFIFLLILISPNIYGQFAYENPVWIKNNTGTALTNVQVMIKFNTAIPISLGRMQNDGRDIRFTTTCGSTSFIPHYIQGYLNTDSTKIWVKVPSIGANDSALVYLYYGNPAATQASTLDVFDGPHSATDSVVVASTNTVSNCQRGFRFTANEDILIGYFGKRIPNATQRYVTLFDFNTQAIIKQFQVDAGTPAVYNYNMLDTPVLIQSGQTCLLALFNGSGDMYYYGTSSQIGQHLTFGDMRYANNCTQNTFPTLIINNMHYGVPDFLYFTKQNVTPPPTYRILAPADSVTPPAPTNLTATPGNGNALLKWYKSTAFDIYSYKVYQNTANNPVTATEIGNVIHPDTSFTAPGLINGTTYYFWVRAVDGYCDPKISAYSDVTSIVAINVKIITSEIPKVFRLNQNYPNPFNPVTRIKFDIPKVCNVEIKLFDITGKEIVNFVKGQYDPGSYLIEFNASYLASGTYFYTMNAGSYSEVKKMIILK